MTKQTEERQQIWVILTIVFLGFIGISMPYLIFPVLFLNPAYSFLPLDWSESSHALFLGITLAAYPLGQFFGSPILGALSDDYGRKRLLAGSLLITAICNLLTGLALEWQQLSLLIASRFMAGFMEGNIAIARAMAADIKTISKHTTFGKINAAASIAFLLGPLLGGLMSDKSLLEGLTTSTPFYFTSLLFLCLAGLSALVLKESMVAIPTEARTLWQRINIPKRISVLFSNKRLQFLMITSTSVTLAIDIFYEFGPVYLTVKWALGPAQLIFYNGVLCLAIAIGNGWLAAFCASRFSNRLTIIGAIGGIALFLLGIVLTDSSFLMVTWFAFIGLAIGLAATLITVKISDSVADAIQGEVMGVQISLRVLGDAIICLLGGVLLLLSSKIILFLAAAISLAATAYYGTGPKNLKRST